MLIPNESDQTVEQIDIERQELAKWGGCNLLKFDALSQWVVGVTAAPK